MERGIRQLQIQRAIDGGDALFGKAGLPQLLFQRRRRRVLHLLDRRAQCRETLFDFFRLGRRKRGQTGLSQRRIYLRQTFRQIGLKVRRHLRRRGEGRCRRFVRGGRGGRRGGGHAGGSGGRGCCRSRFRPGDDRGGSGSRRRGLGQVPGRRGRRACQGFGVQPEAYGGNVGRLFVRAGDKGMPAEERRVLPGEKPERVRGDGMGFPVAFARAQHIQPQTRAGQTDVVFGDLRSEGGEKDLLIPAQAVGQTLLRLGLVEKMPVRVIGQSGPACLQPAAIVCAHVFHAAGPRAQRQRAGGRAVRQSGIEDERRTLVAQGIACRVKGRHFPAQGHGASLRRRHDQKATPAPAHPDLHHAAVAGSRRHRPGQQPFRVLLGDARIKPAARRQGGHGGGQRGLGGQGFPCTQIDAQQGA